jgi:transcriptional regulator with XRE-family HTH domain
MDDLPIFQERLLLARRRAGVSQGELAKRTEMYASDISKMERGRMLPTAPRLRRLAEALGVSADYLLGLTNDPPAAVAAAPQTTLSAARPREDAPAPQSPRAKARRPRPAAPVA